jgi:hypothetical protein
MEQERTFTARMLKILLTLSLVAGLFAVVVEVAGKQWSDAALVLVLTAATYALFVIAREVLEHGVRARREEEERNRERSGEPKP